MYVYPSVDDLMYMKLTKPGSVVLIPSELLSLMVDALSPQNLGLEGDVKLVSAPFYVLKVPPLPTVLKVDRTEQDFRLGAKAEITAPVASGAANVESSVSATFRRKQVTERVRAASPFSPETSLANEYLDEIEENINSLYALHGNELKGKPLIIVYGKRLDAEIIDLLSEETVVKGSPIYIAAPIRLEGRRIDKRIIRALKPFAEEGEVAALLGVDPLPVRLKVGKRVYEIPLAQYLIMKMIEYVVGSNPKDRPEDRFHYYSTLAEYTMDLLLEEATKKGEALRGDEGKYSVNTVFLNSLYLTLVLEYRPRIHTYSSDSVYERLRDIYESAKMTAHDQRRMLAKYAKLLGATDETIRVIKNAGWVFKPYGFAMSWGMETKKYRERERAEEVLSV